MEKYEVIWHDYEDGRTGKPIYVEGNTPKEAYDKAIDELKDYAHMFNASDLEVLIDESGKMHHPDFFDK